MYDLDIPFEYISIIKNECKKYKIPETIYIRHLYQESKFDRNAINYNYRKGKIDSVDKGIAQLNMKWKSDFIWFDNNNKNFNPYDPFISIKISCHYLYRLYKATGMWELAFTAYNCGLSNVRSDMIPEKTKKHINYIFGKLVW